MVISASENGGRGTINGIKKFVRGSILYVLLGAREMKMNPYMIYKMH